MTPPPTNSNSTSKYSNNVDMVRTRRTEDLYPADKITTVDDYDLDELKLEYNKQLDTRGANPTWECWLEHYIEQKNFDWDTFEKSRDELREAIVRDFGVDCLNEPSFMYEDVADYNNRIDQPLTTLKSILVKDDRAKTSFYWGNLTDEEKAEFTNYTPIHSTDEQPITMKHIINTLQKDKHYHNKVVSHQHHNFLEGYEWVSPVVLVFHYGS